MFRKHWRDPHFWRWLWRDRIGLELKALICLLIAALFLGGGWLAADRLAGAQAEATSDGEVTLATTVERVVTVQRNGRVVRKLVPEVQKRVVLGTTTSVRTDVVTVAGGIRTVRTERTVEVPIVTTKVITAAGRATTVVTTKLAPTTTIETKTSTLIQSRTQTQVEVDPVTVTTGRTMTTTRTVTNPVTTTQVVTVTQTVTQPPVTVTVTAPLLTVTL